MPGEIASKRPGKNQHRFFGDLSPSAFRTPLGEPISNLGQAPAVIRNAFALPVKITKKGERHLTEQFLDTSGFWPRKSS